MYFYDDPDYLQIVLKRWDRAKFRGTATFWISDCPVVVCNTLLDVSRQVLVMTLPTHPTDRKMSKYSWNSIRNKIEILWSDFFSFFFVEHSGDSRAVPVRNFKPSQEKNTIPKQSGSSLKKQVYMELWGRDFFKENCYNIL